VRCGRPPKVEGRLEGIAELDRMLAASRSVVMPPLYSAAVVAGGPRERGRSGVVKSSTPRRACSCWWRGMRLGGGRRAGGVAREVAALEEVRSSLALDDEGLDLRGFLATGAARAAGGVMTVLSREEEEAAGATSEIDGRGAGRKVESRGDTASAAG
jgi:hypothetical protein